QRPAGPVVAPNVYVGLSLHEAAFAFALLRQRRFEAAVAVAETERRQAVRVGAAGRAAPANRDVGSYGAGQGGLRACDASALPSARTPGKRFRARRIRRSPLGGKGRILLAPPVEGLKCTAGAGCCRLDSFSFLERAKEGCPRRPLLRCEYVH